MRLDSLRQRFAVLVAAWLVLVMPVLVLTQSAGQAQSPPPPPPSQAAVRMELISRTFNPRAAVPISSMVVPEPAFNRSTEAKVALGRRLFSDKNLSIDRTVSCATCHDPERAFADGRPLAVGINAQVGRRNSPTLVNRGFGRLHFWDGRESSLEELVLQPIADPTEMDLPLPQLRARLEADASYRADFKTAFDNQLSVDTAAAALASYLRTIRSDDSPYDRFTAGATDALSDDARAGLTLFRGKARCAFCHREPLFTDEQVWNTGVALKSDNTLADDGAFAVTGRPLHRGAFKTPTLREVARTAPYMHDGSMATLAEVVDFYDAGGRPHVNKIGLIRPLGLSPEEKRTLVAFLESLSGVVSGK